MALDKGKIRPSKAPEHKEVKPPTRKEVEAFKKKLEEDYKKQKELIEKTFDERMKESSDTVSQRAVGAWERMKAKQLADLEAFYNTQLRALKERAKTASGSREKLAESLRKEAEEWAKGRRLLLTNIMSSIMKTEHVTTEEVAEIDRAINEAINEFTAYEKLHPELDDLFTRIVNKEKLKPEDYSMVVKILNPLDLTKHPTGDKTGIETTAAGLLVGAMSAEQRGELIKTFMRSGRKNETPQLIDAFITLGLITETQAENLLAGTPYLQQVQTKRESGHYERERKRITAAREKQYQKYRGIYAENINNRFWFRKPFWGALAMVWGATTFAVNAMVSYPKGSGKGRLKRVATWMGNMAKNPYTWAGLAAAAGGAEVTGTSMKTGGWVGAGPISRAIESIGEDEEKGPSIEENARKRLEEIRASGPPHLNEYLENGGFKTLQKLRTEILRERKEGRQKRSINIGELLKMETDERQIRRLQALKARTPLSVQTINARFITVSEAAHILKLKTEKAFLETYKKPNATV